MKKISVIAIALTICLIPTNTAKSQSGILRFNPDSRPAETTPAPETCRDVLVGELQERGHPFDPSTQDILDAAIVETSGIIDPRTGGIKFGTLLYRDLERLAEPFLSDRLLSVEPNIYIRAALAEDAAIAIAYSRLNPLCDQPVPR